MYHGASLGGAGLMRVLAIVLLAGLVLGCPLALAANQTVTADSSNQFKLASVTVNQGEMVTWNSTGDFHNVHFDDNSYVHPPTPQPVPWTASRTFNSAGTFGYYCEAHGGAGGVGMSGTVVVNASGGGASPPPTQPGTGGLSPQDATKPVSLLSSPPTQDVDKLYVRASMNEAGALTATGIVDVPKRAARVYRFKPVTRAVSPNVVAKLRLKLSKKSLKAVKRALTRKRLRAKVTVTAKDGAGNRTTRKRTIRLTR
jgi:plastocyanin